MCLYDNNLFNTSTLLSAVPNIKIIITKQRVDIT